VRKEDNRCLDFARHDEERNEQLTITIMKKKLLLMMMCCPMMLAAQNGITVTNLAVNAGSSSTVTFNVSWKNTGMPPVWSDSVWVWVDYNNNGMMERLPLSAGATLTTTSAPGVGKVIAVPNNNKGVWVVGNARGSGAFSATVKLLTAIADVAGACAYASNYQPAGEYNDDATGILFTGTPEYEVTLAGSDGKNVTVMSGETFLLPCDYTLSSFTDATGAPGGVSCTPPVKQTLLASASAYCSGTGGVRFALNATELGVTYQLYANNVPKSGATLTGTGSAATFTGSFEVGTYSARTVAGGAFCPAEMAGTVPISLRSAAGANQTADAVCGCVTGTTSCSGSCTTNRTYTTNDGACASNCGQRYVQTRNQCGTVIYAQSSTISDVTCKMPCAPVRDAGCTGGVTVSYSGATSTECSNLCYQQAVNLAFGRYDWVYTSSSKYCLCNMCGSQIW
jgi:hypothetical protein